MKTQDQILIFLHDRVRKQHYSPSTREIGEAVGLSSPATVNSHLHVLKTKGLVNFEEKKPRTTTVTKKGLNRIWELKGR